MLKIRIGRIILAVAGIAISFALMGAAIDEGIHRYRVHQAGGDWCLTIHPDGSHALLYGAKACGY